MASSRNETDKFKLHRFEKNNYFYGKLMTVRDFDTEQSYNDEKRHLINRLLHGSGLVCGFEDIQIENNGDKITINIIDGGMALDCCGREIVVPANSLGKQISDSGGNSVPDLTANPFLYIKYKPCYDGYVAAASNPSSCEERCCPCRLVEDFEVVASDQEPDLKSIVCRDGLSGESGNIVDVKEWLETLETDRISCPQCEKNQEYKIFIGKVETVNGGFAVNRWDTEKYRIFFSQKELYQLLKCHILDADNPHKVTAAQTGALVSVSGVSNPGGNIVLIPGANITITPDTAAHTIELASTGGALPGQTVKSVGRNLNPGNLDKYSREDHVHNLEKNIVDFENLSDKLQKQLNLLFMYLRERALKCTVTIFKPFWRQFQIEIALKIVKETKDAVDGRIYEDEIAFVDFMGHLLEMMKEFADKIRGNVTEESFDKYMKSLEELEGALSSGDALQVAIKQDEVCFYVTELETREG